MTRHIFKLVWNRKRSTGLILAEILICFLVLAGISSGATSIYQRWQKSQGIDYKNVWGASISGMGYGSEGEQLDADRRAQAELLRIIAAMPEVEAVAASNNTPFSGSSWTNGTYIDGQAVSLYWNLASVDLPAVLKLKLLQGRWPADTDGALGYQPIVISRSLAEGLFGTTNPIGQDIPTFDEEGQPSTPEEDARIERVVGVMENYRRYSFRDGIPHKTMQAVDYTNSEEIPQELLIRVNPGVTAEFEEKLMRTLQQVAPQWTYRTELLEDRRADQMNLVITPMIIVSVIAVFLIIMVGLGLVGVLWQNVTRRTGELGLRRALGATEVSVRMQILRELWTLTALAVVAGSLLYIQLPLLGANFGAGWSVYLAGLAAACVVIFTFVTICGLYPTWLAMRIQPAAALQHE